MVDRSALSFKKCYQSIISLSLLLSLSSLSLFIIIIIIIAIIVIIITSQPKYCYKEQYTLF